MNAAPHPSEMAFAVLCASRAALLIDGNLLLHEAVDELQAVAERSGLIDAIGQDAAQDIMGVAFAAVDLMPDADEQDLGEACEAEIMLRAGDLVRQWELNDPRDRWRHTGERRPIARPEPPARSAPYRVAASTVDAFLYVTRLDDPDYLTRWLADHPADAPELFKIWKSKAC